MQARQANRAPRSGDKAKHEPHEPGNNMSVLLPGVMSGWPRRLLAHRLARGQASGASQACPRRLFLHISLASLAQRTLLSLRGQGEACQSFGRLSRLERKGAAGQQSCSAATPYLRHTQSTRAWRWRASGMFEMGCGRGEAHVVPTALACPSSRLPPETPWFLPRGCLI